MNTFYFVSPYLFMEDSSRMLYYKFSIEAFYWDYN